MTLSSCDHRFELLASSHSTACSRKEALRQIKPRGNYRIGYKLWDACNKVRRSAKAGIGDKSTTCSSLGGGPMRLPYRGSYNTQPLRLPSTACGFAWSLSAAENMGRLASNHSWISRRIVFLLRSAFCKLPATQQLSSEALAFFLRFGAFKFYPPSGGIG